MGRSLRKPTKVESNRFLIELSMFKCHVLVTWEKDIDKIIKWAIKNGVKISEKWKGEFNECAGNDHTQGVCMSLGDKNNDVLVWLKERPRKTSQYGVLYHELHHAVGQLAKDHSMSEETEAMAYMFEYLVNRCNQYLWK